MLYETINVRNNTDLVREKGIIFLNTQVLLNLVRSKWFIFTKNFFPKHS